MNASIQTHCLHTLLNNGNLFRYYSLPKLAQVVGFPLDRLPFSIRILLENCLRNLGKPGFSIDQIEELAKWQPTSSSERPPVAFLPARILMQDFTGLPVLNDLSALRAALKRSGRDPALINPRIPVDLVIDHSLTVEAHACTQAQRINEEREFQLNRERYQFLKWAQQAYKNLRVLPPGLGICHQVNLEYLALVVFTANKDGEDFIFPDTVMGTDSHTTMINGLGVAGWGVGGIEALAAMLNYPSEFPIPDVIGLEIIGTLPENATPTDLTLTLTSRLRELGVVGKFVELFGAGYASLPVETRAMIANMSPESGATMTYCPVDEQTLNYLRRTGRPDGHVTLVDTYFRAQGLFSGGSNITPSYSQILRIRLNEIQPTLAGPKRPQDIFPLAQAPARFHDSLSAPTEQRGYGLAPDELKQSIEVQVNGEKLVLNHGAVLIAAITSCTNTSDASVMIAAGLLARNAARKGLKSKPWVKTSFAPGSRAVTAYLAQNGLLDGLESLGFHVVGYGCSTCIGNSGPLVEAVSQAVRTGNLVGAAVLSGNRNFEGRIHPDVRASFLASPPLVVAYALAGSLTMDFEHDPLGKDQEGQPVYLRDIYPSRLEISQLTEASLKKELYRQNYMDIFNSNPSWNALPVAQGLLFNWQVDSPIIQEPAFLLGDPAKPAVLRPIENAYALALLGDSITTDHISPAGRISSQVPAGQYLASIGIAESDFISFGARRGSHEVMARGTLSNPRLHNSLADGRDGGFTRHFPDGEIMTIYAAAQRYQREGCALIILAGKAYGSGSSRDWAAKGVYLLGVRAVIAQSYERIHRTNLVCLGVLPLEFLPGQSAASLRLRGDEEFTIPAAGIINALKPHVTVIAEKPDGGRVEFEVLVRVDTPLELAYYRAGGLMRKVAADL